VQKYTQNIGVLILILILCNLAASAQVLQWSNTTKIKGAAVFTKVIGENQNGVFMMRYRNRFYTKNIILERYNHLLVQEQSETIDLRNARLIKVYMTDKGILLIKSKYNKMRQENDLLGQWYAFDLKPVGEPTVLATTTVREFGDRGNFRLRISDDLQSLALLYTEPGTTEAYVMHQKRFDIGLNLDATKNVELPYEYDLFYVNDFLITNSKEVMLMCSVVEKDRRRIKKSTPTLYHWKDSVLQDFVIADSLTTKSIALSYDRSTDNAIISGLYGQGESYGLTGAFFFTLNAKRDGGTLVVSPFETNFISEVNVNARNEGAVSEGFEIIKAVPRSDGGVLIIAEQKEIATENDVVLVNGIPQSTSKNIYNFNELLIINYDNGGFVDWHKVITKNQTTVNDGGYFSSVAIYIGDKYIQLLYNDQLRSSGEVMQCTIYNNGHVESSKLLKTQLDFVAIIPEESKQVSSNKLIIPTSKNRRFALLKLVYH
jgi:hypothetical protein